MELKDLKAGDKVIIEFHSSGKIATIDRVTKTQIIVGSTRYRRDNGWKVAKSESDTDRIRVCSADDIERIMQEKSRESIILYIRRYNWNRISSGVLEKIYNILKNAGENE